MFPSLFLKHWDSLKKPATGTIETHFFLLSKPIDIRDGRFFVWFSYISVILLTIDLTTNFEKFEALL